MIMASKEFFSFIHLNLHDYQALKTFREVMAVAAQTWNLMETQKLKNESLSSSTTYPVKIGFRIINSLGA